MPYLKTPSGLNWHYTIEGPSTGSGQAERQTLLFLHGFGVDSRIWRQQVKYFSDRFQTIAIDLPGHGKSEWQNVSLAAMAEDINFFLKSLNIAETGIVASSFGGLVALKLSEISTERIKFLVFAGSQPKFSRSEDYPYGLEVSRIQKLAGQVETDYPSIVNIFFRSLFTRQERESRRFKWVQTFRQNEDVADQAALLALLNILEKEDLREIFHGLQKPILFLNGTEDYICQKSFYESLSDRFVNARFAWFERCGHFPFVSRPIEFNQKLEEFLNLLPLNGGVAEGVGVNHD